VISNLAGMPVVVSAQATVAYEDWSACRSPSRAKRRERLGHPQRVVRGRQPGAYHAQGKLYVHPDVYATLTEPGAPAHDRL